MSEPAASLPAGTITILSLSATQDDHAVLAQTLRESSLTLYPNCRVALETATTVESALGALRGQRIPIVLCDGDAPAEGWREILKAGKEWPAAPCVIVTSRVADDSAWAEALNAGAFDMLSKPFNKSDVMRTIQSAWKHWRNRYGLADGAGECQVPG